MKNKVIKDINVLNASANAYSLYTSGLQTYFANNILCSSQDFNLFGKTVNNKLDTQRLEYVKNNEQYTMDDFIKEFGDISSTVYYGQLQHILYNGFKLGLSKDYESLIDKQYGSYAYSAKYGIDMLWSKPKDLPNIDGEEACYIVLMEKDVILSKNLYKVGTIVDLPYNEKGWYCVADTNIYYDKYEIKTNTVLEKVV